MCGGEGATHYCKEFDCMLHARCVVPFLASEEGQVVVAHGHTVEIRFEDELPFYLSRACAAKE